MSEPYLRERKFQKLNRLLLIALVPITGYCAVLGVSRGDNYAAVQAGLALAMYTIPLLITHFLKFLIPQDCRFLYYVFTFCTIVVGSALYGYSRIPYWDKIFHFFSGILISAAGLIVCQMLFGTLAGEKKVHCILYTLFPFLFNLSIAALWEIYEYMLFLLLKIDAVNHLTTGVHDTLQDMIVCLIGGLVFSVSILRAFRQKKLSFLLKVCKHFFEMRREMLEL